MDRSFVRWAILGLGLATCFSIGWNYLDGGIGEREVVSSEQLAKDWWYQSEIHLIAAKNYHNLQNRDRALTELKEAERLIDQIDQKADFFHDELVEERNNEIHQLKREWGIEEPQTKDGNVARMTGKGAASQTVPDPKVLGISFSSSPSTNFMSRGGFGELSEAADYDFEEILAIDYIENSRHMVTSRSQSTSIEVAEPQANDLPRPTDHQDPLMVFFRARQSSHIARQYEKMGDIASAIRKYEESLNHYRDLETGFPEYEPETVEKKAAEISIKLGELSE